MGCQLIDFVALVLQVSPEKAVLKLIGLGACVVGAGIMLSRRGIFWAGAALACVGILALLS